MKGERGGGSGIEVRGRGSEGRGGGSRVEGGPTLSVIVKEPSCISRQSSCFLIYLQFNSDLNYHNKFA